MIPSETYRQHCFRCLRTHVACYCASLKPFDAPMRFVVLMHPNERRRAIASGRMAHLAMANSHLVEGIDFTEDAQVKAWLADPALHCVILYPGDDAIDLGSRGGEWIPNGKQLLVFVIDGTWSKARKMMRLSHNLQSLPKVSFKARKLSGFIVRKQPKSFCLSSLEAMHEVIELMASDAFKASRPHDTMLDVFHQMVHTQITSEELGRWSGNE